MVDTSVIVLEPVTELANIQTLQDAGQQAFESGAAVVTVDASSVEMAKTPAFQFLLTLQKNLQEQNRTLVISEPSDAFKGMAKCLGVLNILHQEKPKMEE